MIDTPFWWPYLQRIGSLLALYRSYIPMLALALGIAIFLLVQGGLSWSVQSNRQTPYPLDEALYYLSQASRIPECLGPCLALRQIRTQTDTPSEVYDISFQRWALRYHELVLQNPLPALLMVIPHSLGFSWWAVYNALIVLGRLLQVLALTYLLSIVWGRIAAGIALVLTAFTIFPSYGLHHIVPSNIAQMIAFLIWGRILLKGRAANGVLIWGTLILLLTHPQGRILAGIAWALYVFPGAWPQQRREWMAISLSLGAILLYSLLGMGLRWPELAYFGTLARPEGMSAQAALLENIRRSFDYVTAWYLGFPFQILGALLVILVGLWTLAPEQRRRALWLLALVGAVSLVLSLHTIPECCWAESFRRQFMLFQILIYGAVGHVLWVCLCYVWEHGLPVLFGTRRGSLHSAHLWVLVGALVMLYITGRYSAYQVANGWQSVQAEIELMQHRQNYDFQEATVQRLLEESNPPDQVLYRDMVARQYTLLNGGRELGAIFYPAIAGSEMEAEWLASADLRFIMTSNPIETFDREMIQVGELELANIPYLRYSSSEAIRLNSLHLWIENPGPAFELAFVLPDGTLYPLPIPANHMEWIALSEAPDVILTTFEVRPSNAPAHAVLKGWRFGTSDLLWPWDVAGQLTTYSPRRNQEVTASFVPQDLFPGTGRTVEILLDRGYLVLARLTSQSSPD